MVFRRDSKVDAFQRQLSALRHQLGGESEPYALSEHDRDSRTNESAYRTGLPDLDVMRSDDTFSASTLQVPGSRERVEDPRFDMPPVPAIDMNTSVISPATSWNGNLESAGSLHVHGRVEGTLSAANDIFIAEEAVVDAQVSAAHVTIAGNVRGSIQCSARFEVLPRGRVSGEVRAPIIVVHEGAILACDIAMSISGGEKSATAASSARSIRSGA